MEKLIIYRYPHLKRVLGKLARFCVNFIPEERALPIIYGNLRGKKWIVNSASYGCWTGTYEPEKQTVFQSLVTEGNVVFDIGAHVGFYTLLASALVGPTGKVFAFEPLPRNIIYIKKHLYLNKVTNAAVVEIAVSDKDGTSSFRERADSSMGHFSEDGELQVKTVRLDKLIETEKMPVPDYIKIDVEGAEIKVLAGAKNTLKKFSPTLFLATHGSDIYYECVEVLEELGYNLKLIDHKDEFRRCEILAYQ